MKYNVNKKTLAVIPIGVKKSQVLEKNKNYELPITSYNNRKYQKPLKKQTSKIYHQYKE